MNKLKAFLMAMLVTASAVSTTAGSLTTVSAAGSYDMNVTIDLAGETKEISPYIYGINQYGNESIYKQVTATALRQGGNRMTAYNWENNASNAGSDWLHSSDNNLTDSNEPADCVQTLSKDAANNNIDYKLTTLQLAGYVAADKDGTVEPEEAAPSKRWNEVVFTKGSDFADTPDLTDGKVYMDEYVNYIVNKLGDAESKTGIQGYSLDNEPALWHETHSRMHAKPVTCEELRDKSVEMAKAIKAVDPKAEVFGPALYGYTAFDHLADDENSDEWETIKAAGGYHWYLDYYLDEMKKASEEAGTRLLDVLDIHYYSESARNNAEDRVQSVRTLYEDGFVENSWIGQWCMENVPILPTVQKSIDTYYPGTKLAISEYNYGGGNDVSGTIAEVETLGCFADAGVYFASLWDSAPYIFSGINLYTNYDGKGGHFGDTLVPTKTDDVSLASSYAAINGEDSSVVTAMLTNKSMTDSEQASISLKNAKGEYKSAAVYAVYGDDEKIKLLDIVDDVTDNTVKFELPAFSAAMVVISEDADAFADLEIYDPSKYSKKVEEYTDLADRINANGFIELPITDAEHLSKIILTADVTSTMGSSWGTAGCAVCIDAQDKKDGTQFWTYKDYTMTLGKPSTATIAFDGIFSNDGTDVEAFIYDKKVELQQWWQAAEKGEDDVIDVKYLKAEIVYEYVNETPDDSGDSDDNNGLHGDVNLDGKVSIADAVLLSRYVSEDTTVNALFTDMKQSLANAEVTGDTDLTFDDVSNILLFIARLLDTL